MHTAHTHVYDCALEGTYAAKHTYTEMATPRLLNSLFRQERTHHQTPTRPRLSGTHMIMQEQIQNKCATHNGLVLLRAF